MTNAEAEVIRLKDHFEAHGRTAKIEKWLQDVLHALPAALYVTDATGRITYYNEAAADLWGHRPELGTVYWCGAWKLYWPDGTPLPHDQCPMAIALKEQRSVRGMEAIAERPDGTRVHFVPYPTLLRDTDDKVVGAVNVLVDITEHKRSDEIAQRLASIVESSDDAIVSKDLDGVIRTWNKGAERIFGYLSEEIVGRHITILIPPERRHEEPAILERLRRGERIDHYETIRVRKDGTPIDISLTVSPIKDATGKTIGASKIARDITERKRHEAQIVILAREAEHRAKNVLTTVLATVRLAQSDTPEGLKRAIEGRIQALANVHRLFAETRWRGADLHTVLKQEIAAYCPSGEAGVSFDGPHVVLEPDVAQAVGLAIHELATNAVKYGALSVSQGHIQVTWSLGADRRLAIQWIETGGPPVQVPTRQGFGTRVMDVLIRNQMGGNVRFDWRPGGLACEIVIPL